MELQDRRPAKQQGTRRDAQRAPRGEHHQRQRDPAAACGHSGRPERRVGEGEIGPAETGAGATEQDGEEADLPHLQPEGVCRDVVVPDGAQGQARARAPEEPRHAGDEGDRRVDEGVLPEHQLPDPRQIREAGDREMRRRIALHADVVRAEKSRQAEPEDGQREAGGDLVRRETDREDSEQGGEQEARAGSAERTEKGRVGLRRHREAGGGAEDHHPFETEVEHPRALRDEFADAGEDEGRRGGQDRDEHHLDDVEGHDLLRLPSRLLTAPCGPMDRPARSGRDSGRTRRRRARGRAAAPERRGSGRGAASDRSALPRRRWSSGR